MPKVTSMRLSAKSLLLIIISIFSIMVLTGPAFASKAEELLAKAKRAADKASLAKKSIDRDELYEKALKYYSDVANDRRYKGTPEAAKALYEIGKLKYKAEGKVNNKYNSQEILKSLIIEYDQPREVLIDRMGLTRAEALEVEKIVKRAKALREAVVAELDKENSKSILYKIMDTLVKLTGRVSWFSYWFAIVLITVIVKILITPLTKAQFKSMREMQRVAPLIKEIQAQYKGDPKTIQEKTMDLYKQHGINPLAGCLPLLVQMPILMLLYYTIRSYEFQFANGTFLWIGSSLSHLTSIHVPVGMGGTVWITAKSLAEPDLILLVLYLVSMYISTKVSSVDPTQAEQQKTMAIMMPLIFGIFFAGFPSAFMFYWLMFNILQTSQQYLILRDTKLQPVPVNAASSEDASGGNGEDSGEGPDEPRPRRRRRTK